MAYVITLNVRWLFDSIFCPCQIFFKEEVFEYIITSFSLDNTFSSSVECLFHGHWVEPCILVNSYSASHDN